MWRVLGAMERMSGTSVRAREREQSARDNLLAKLIEKRDLAPDAAARLHVHERMQAKQVDASLERVIQAANRKRPPPRPAAPKPDPVEPVDPADLSEAMHQ